MPVTRQAALRRFVTGLLGLLFAALAQQGVADDVPGKATMSAAPAASGIELHARNFVAWRDHIQPTAPELAWTRIPWSPTFADGLNRAAASDKPLLLWVMNGHPLGCT